MSNILYLAHRIPFPPNKGDKIRSFNALRHLSSRHNVYLAAFIDDAEDWQHVERLGEYCAELFVRPVGGWRSGVSALSAMLQGQSLSVGYYKDRAMQDWLSSVVASQDISVAIAFSSTMARYLPSPDTGDLALIADFVDLDSDKWRQYSNSGVFRRSHPRDHFPTRRTLSTRQIAPPGSLFGQSDGNRHNRNIPPLSGCL